MVTLSKLINNASNVYSFDKLLFMTEKVKVACPLVIQPGPLWRFHTLHGAEAALGFSAGRSYGPLELQQLTDVWDAVGRWWHI